MLNTKHGVYRIRDLGVTLTHLSFLCYKCCETLLLLKLDSLIFGIMRTHGLQEFLLSKGNPGLLFILYFCLECDMGKCMFYILFPFNILFYIHKCADFIYNQAACLCLVPLKVRWREPGLQVMVTHHVTARNWIWFSERAVCVLNCLAAFHLFIYIFKLWEMQGNMIIPVTEYEVLTYDGLSRLRDPYLNTWSPV